MNKNLVVKINNKEKLLKKEAIKKEANRNYIKLISLASQGGM